MIKEIKYGGMATTPSEYECQDGDLDYAKNVTSSGAGMESLGPVDSVAELDNKPIFIHKGRLIMLKENEDSISLCFMKDGDNKVTNISGAIFPKSAASLSLTSVGNTLVANTTEGLHYFLWESDGYRYLGEKPPRIELTFGLKAGFAYPGQETRGEAYFDDFGFTVGWSYDDMSEDQQKSVTDAVYGRLNKLLIEHDEKEHKGFSFPFFVRYAYRLYDGSLYMHSDPVLMLPTTRIPFAVATKASSTSGGSSKYMAIAINCLMDVALNKYVHTDEDSLRTLMGRWRDIVKSIDVFISKPLYTYDSNANIVRYGGWMQGGLSIVKKQDGDRYKVFSDSLPSSTSEGDLFSTAKDLDGDSIWNKVNDLNFFRFEERSIDDDIRNISTFYYARSYKLFDVDERDEDEVNLGELSTKRKYVDFGQRTISYTSEVMSDDYASGDSLHVGDIAHFNNRLCLSNVTRRFSVGNSLLSRICYQDFDNVATDNTMKVEMVVDGKSILVERTEPGMAGIVHYGYPDFLYVPYLYYGNLGAKMFYYDSGTNHGASRMEQSAFLNGCYAFEGFDTLLKSNYRPYGTYDSDIEEPNKIYVSDVNNPFVFTPQNILTVGTDPIITLAQASHAMSEGQFGQYPVIAFTYGGVWAIEVSSTGVFSSARPISRECALNKDSIISVDDKVLFATKRGVYMTRGSQVELVSGQFLPNKFFDENLYRLEEAACSIDAEYKDLGVSFTEFINSSSIAYDYANNRVYFSSPNKGYSYIYSLKTGLWHMVDTVFDDVLNTYPETYIVNNGDNSFVLRDISNASQVSSSIIITRPLKLDLPDTFKTIERIIQRGNFEPSHVKQILYGSNDLKTWRLLASSVDKYLNGLRGHAYKYFRLALFMNLEEGESLTGCTIQFQPRGTNVLR